MLERLEESKAFIVEEWEDTKSIIYNKDIPEVKLWNGEPNMQNMDASKVYVLTEDPFRISEYATSIGLKCITLVCNNATSPVSFLNNGLVDHSSLFIRSNISKSFRDGDILMNLKRGEIILASNVTMIKDHHMRSIKEFNTDIVFARPLDSPSTYIDSEMRFTNDDDRQYVRKVLKKIFSLGTNYQCIVLNEFGCGLLGNPTYEICEIINELIKEYPISCVLICIKMADQEKIINPCDDHNNFVFQDFNKFIERD